MCGGARARVSARPLATSQWARAAIVLMLPLLRPEAPSAQLASSNLLLAQVGNYPGVAPTNRQDLYDQVNLAYGLERTRFGLRFETDRNSEQQFAYEGVTQRWAEWSDERARLRVGNFYTILGRGLIHRSFEIPGVVLDQVGIRSRYAFSREMDGALAEVDLGRVSARAFSGTANVGENSLAADRLGLSRYSGQLSGAQITGEPYPGAKLGAAYQRSSLGGAREEELGSGFLELDPLGLVGSPSASLPLYLEYAQANGDFGEWWRMRRGMDVPHALYASTGLVWGRLGVSAEWKDYAQFRKGTNDPPSLVREQSYTLLNRATHVLDATRETGYQLELTSRVTEWLSLTANVSRADGVAINRYREQFFEVRLAPQQARRWDLAAFLDTGKDGLAILDRGRTGGGVATVRFLDAWSSRLDVEFQSAEHPNLTLPPVPYQNLFVSFTAARADWGSVAMIWDRTSDPLERSAFGSDRAFLHLVSWVTSAHLSPQQDATLTVGKQRGGRACTAGTCYEVQPFQGAELRLLSRF